MTAASIPERGETDAGTIGSPPRRRAPWAWLVGGDGVVLRHVPSEASFFDGLGMWVAGMAVVSGFGMTVAASQWWSTSIVSVLWVLPLWAVLYCLIERLVLKSFGTSWAWNLVLTIPRLLLSLAIALGLGRVEPRVAGLTAGLAGFALLSVWLWTRVLETPDRVILGGLLRRLRPAQG